MARLDTTAVWFLRGENEKEMAETPSTEERRGVSRMAWVGVAVALTVAIFVAVMIGLAHASRVVDEPLAEPGATATASAAVPSTLPALQIASPAPQPQPAAKVETPAAKEASTPRVIARTPSPELLAAEKLLRRGRAAAALTRFQSVLARDNDDPRALRGACVALGKLGRPNDAARVCRRALDRAPDDLETRRALATVYYNGGAYKWSASEWQKVVAKAPHDTAARRALRAARARSDRG